MKRILAAATIALAVFATAGAANAQTRNRVVVDQAGHSNAAAAYQQGDRNGAVVMQTGNGHYARGVQTGYNNFLRIRSAHATA